VSAPPGRRRVRARVEGVVQGVGFRPYVHRLASELGLGGHVLNDARGVLLEVEAGDDAVARFLERLPREAPPLASVERVTVEDLPAAGERAFAIVASAPGAPAAPVAPDAATCASCLAELLDPDDRRHRYPFITCTNCGPRFTVVVAVPYDRARTTMAPFLMCPPCRAEYEDPADRRFHAETNACPACGPRARLLLADGTPAEADGPDAVRAAAGAIADGLVVAVKGLGGFHLACRADDEAVVGRLRARKRREERPLALMVADLAAAGRLVALGPEDEAALLGPARPIVVAPRLAGADAAPSVAPRSGDLGVMLPYTPLHHLLLGDVGAPLVMTSGNVSDEPIAYRDEDALARLAGIADRFLTNDRKIRTRTDDSVLRAIPGRRPLVLRRSRGEVPGQLALPVPSGRPVLACGAELKSTFCLARGSTAWVGHHIGDLGNEETLRSFREGIAHFERLFAVVPEVVAHDLHPAYLSTAYALEREGVDLVGVQHHHAHLAAALAEAGETGPAVGAIFDGTGHGPDGTVWGGEILVGDLRAAERAGHLRPVRLPGSEAAIREPWRMACAWLVESLGEEVPAPPPTLRGIDAGRWRAIAALSRGGPAAPVTTSVGRLFDAVAALCGLRASVTYEGQAAAELEAAADPSERGALPVAVEAAPGEAIVLDPVQAIRRLAAEVRAGTPAAALSARFHRGLADATARACALAAERAGLDRVVLSGGVFQNRLLLTETAARLDALGLRVLVPARLPPNDGGVAYGQAAVAAAR
jgi:hydrogenase maturation protein HypF